MTSVSDASLDVVVLSGVRNYLHATQFIRLEVVSRRFAAASVAKRNCSLHFQNVKASSKTPGIFLVKITIKQAGFPLFTMKIWASDQLAAMVTSLMNRIRKFRKIVISGGETRALFSDQTDVLDELTVAPLSERTNIGPMLAARTFNLRRTPKMNDKEWLILVRNDNFSILCTIIHHCATIGLESMRSSTRILIFSEDNRMVGPTLTSIIPSVTKLIELFSPSLREVVLSTAKTTEANWSIKDCERVFAALSNCQRLHRLIVFHLSNQEAAIGLQNCLKSLSVLRRFGCHVQSNNGFLPENWFQNSFLQQGYRKKLQFLSINCALLNNLFEDSATNFVKNLKGLSIHDSVDRLFPEEDDIMMKLSKVACKLSPSIRLFIHCWFGKDSAWPITTGQIRAFFSLPKTIDARITLNHGNYSVVEAKFREMIAEVGKLEPFSGIKIRLNGNENLAAGFVKRDIVLVGRKNMSA